MNIDDALLTVLMWLPDQDARKRAQDAIVDVELRTKALYRYLRKAILKRSAEERARIGPWFNLGRAERAFESALKGGVACQQSKVVRVRAESKVVRVRATHRATSAVRVRSRHRR